MGSRWGRRLHSTKIAKHSFTLLVFETPGTNGAFSDSFGCLGRLARVIAVDVAHHVTQRGYTLPFDRRLAFGLANCQVLIASLLLHQEGVVDIESEWTARKREQMGDCAENQTQALIEVPAS